MITSRQNEKIKTTAKLRQKKYRDETGLFLIEGRKLFAEAIASHQTMHEVFYTSEWFSEATAEERLLLTDLTRAGVPLEVVSQPVLEALTDQKRPEGIVCVLELPKTYNQGIEFLRYDNKFGRRPHRYVILEDVQDPGNVGTIIRTADAAGYSAVFITAGTADAYSPKVLRAAMGSVFHLPVVQVGELRPCLHVFMGIGGLLIGSSLKGEYMSELGQRDADYSLILGNESRGISPMVEDVCDLLVKIPIYGKAESLNVAVAAGILLYGLMDI